MQPPFFEHDPDEIIFNGNVYLDYFNLFPNLHLSRRWSYFIRLPRSLC